jgi:FkbM family methyltransferase
MTTFVKRLVYRLPARWQQELKRLHFARRIQANRFTADEPEADWVAGVVGPGDWVLDVGANVGHYTIRLAGLVGPAGRVIAFEPVPSTFELLAANVAIGTPGNVTLVNAAASSGVAVVRMDIPNLPGAEAKNYYMASIRPDGGQRVLSLSVDSLRLPHPIRLVKIDAEGHERQVLEGMVELLERDGPVLIVEGDDLAVEDLLTGLGYSQHRLGTSWNRIYQRRATQSA